MTLALNFIDDTGCIGGLCLSEIHNCIRDISELSGQANHYLLDSIRNGGLDISRGHGDRCFDVRGGFVKSRLLIIKILLNRVDLFGGLFDGSKRIAKLRHKLGHQLTHELTRHISLLRQVLIKSVHHLVIIRHSHRISVGFDIVRSLVGVALGMGAAAGVLGLHTGAGVLVCCLPGEGKRRNCDRVMVIQKLCWIISWNLVLILHGIQKISMQVGPANQSVVTTNNRMHRLTMRKKKDAVIMVEATIKQHLT